MKSILFVCITFLSMVSANALTVPVQDVASVEFGHHQLNINYKITATLSEFGHLSVAAEEIGGTGSPYLAGKQLEFPTYRALEGHIYMLANAQIVHQYYPMVCKMLAPIDGMINTLSVREGYDYNGKQFTGEIRAVLGPQGCFIADKIYPEGDYSMRAAQQLRFAMRVLALDIIGSQLPQFIALEAN